MAKFIEVEGTDLKKITINVDFITYIASDDGKVIIYLANPTNSGRAYVAVDKPYNEFIKWFLEQIGKTKDYSNENRLVLGSAPYDRKSDDDFGGEEREKQEIQVQGRAGRKTGFSIPPCTDTSLTNWKLFNNSL